MKTYEQMFILAPDLDEDGEKTLVEKLTTVVKNDGGEVLDAKRWGKRKLCYEIKNHVEGIYWVMTFKAPPTVMIELRRLVKITDGFIRDIIIDLTYAQKAVKRREEHLKASEARRATRALERASKEQEKPPEAETLDNIVGE